MALVAASLLVALRAPLAQVGSIATTAPILSPVGLWRSATRTAGPGVAASTLSVRINSGATQTIPALVDNRINAFPTPVSITTEWSLSSPVSTVDLVGYFSTPSAALSAPGSTIPSSRIEGRMVSGQPTSFTPFSGNGVRGVGAAGASLTLFRQSIIAPVNGVGQRTDDLELRLVLRGLPKLPPGTYRGTLTLRAIAY